MIHDGETNLWQSVSSTNSLFLRILSLSSLSGHATSILCTRQKIPETTTIISTCGVYERLG
jgi:hypothetical protein